MMPKTIVLGDEYDEKLREAILAILRELGGQITGRWRGLGGSQEIEKLSVTIDGKVLEVEAETYVGLSISGDAEVVDRVARRVNERASATSA